MNRVRQPEWAMIGICAVPTPHEPRQQRGIRTVRWTLTYDDLFDREATPTVQATGADLLEGLTLLWNLHLREGVQDDGQRTF